MAEQVHPLSLAEDAYVQLAGRMHNEAVAMAKAADKAVTGAPPFAMFGGDARHTGRRGGAAPAKAPVEVWSVDVHGVVAGSPTIGRDGTIYVASHDGGLYAIDRAGKVLWTFKTGDRSWSTPAVAEDGTIYVGSDDDHLYAVKSDGSLKWKLRLGDCDPKGFGPESSRCDVDGGPTIGPDGTVYVGGDGIHAVWPDGTLRWKLATAEHVASTPALAADGTVYAGSEDDALYAVKPDGAVKWSIRTGDDVDHQYTVERLAESVVDPARMRTRHSAGAAHGACSRASAPRRRGTAPPL